MHLSPPLPPLCQSPGGPQSTPRRDAVRCEVWSLACTCCLPACLRVVWCAGATRLRPPSHDGLRAFASKHAELVRVVAALDAQALPGLRAAYSGAVNMLLRCACSMHDPASSAQRRERMGAWL